MALWTADWSGNIGVTMPSPRMKMPSCARSIGRVKRILTEKPRFVLSRAAAVFVREAYRPLAFVRRQLPGRESHRAPVVGDRDALEHVQVLVEEIPDLAVETRRGLRSWWRAKGSSRVSIVEHRRSRARGRRHRCSSCGRTFGSPGSILTSYW